MYSSCIRSFSLTAIFLCGSLAAATGPTWALPHAQLVAEPTLELSGGYAQFPQGGLAVARFDFESPIKYGVYGSLMAHEWLALGQLDERFVIGGLRYPIALGSKTQLAPFVQSVYFDGSSPLDRRLTARAGVALQNIVNDWSWDLSLPLVGAKVFPVHPSDSTWSWLGPLDLLLATEAGLTWRGWTNHELRVGLMGALIRLSYKTMVRQQVITAQLASMGSHSFFLLGWEKSWSR